MCEAKAYELKSWCDRVVSSSDLAPANGVTFCNIAVHRICRGMGFDKFEGILANQIYEYCVMNWERPWGEKEDMGKQAAEAAGKGDLVIAAVKGNPHGHCAIVYPKGPMLYSGKWGMYVPRVANVGKENGVMGANYAFRDPPEYFIRGFVKV